MRITIDERDITALRVARDVVRGLEETFGDDPLLGTRKGEAASDVLAAIVIRAERAIEGREDA
jgi:hypothetical protein